MKGIKKFTANMLMGANVASIIVMLLIGFSDRIDPEQHPILSCLGLTFPVILVVNLGFLIFWAVISLKRVLVPLLGFIVCYSPIRSYFPLNLGSSDTPDIHLLSYNAGGFSCDANGVRGGSYDDALAYAEKTDADIVCLQESPIRPGFERRFRDKFPYIEYTKHNQNVGNTVAILSKFPIVKQEYIDYESRGNLSAAYWVDVNGRTVIIVNNHLESAGLTSKDRHEFRGMVHGDKGKDETRQETKRLLVKLGENNAIRAQQVKAIARFVKQHEGTPIIVCGDFNDSPISYPTYKMSEQLTNCYRESGNGLGWTFCRDAIRVRIDHVFCSSELTPLRSKIDKSVTASDHYPLLCELKWSEISQK